MDLISVVIPVYNREDTILRSINSVLSQQYTSLEIFVVDDQSQDRTIEIVREMMDKDSRINLAVRPDERQKGANACRNIGIEKARGEYIAFLDSDDEWENTKLVNDHKTITTGRSIAGVFGGIIIDDGEFRSKSFTRKIFEGSPMLISYLLRTL